MYKPYSDHELAQQRGRAEAQRLYPVLGPCEGGCGAEAKHRHHVDGNCNNNDRSNLLFLCAKCHAGEHPEGMQAFSQAGAKASGAVRSAITHCPKGHPYSGDNLYIDPIGQRHCKECVRLRYLARMAVPGNRAAKNERDRLYRHARMADPVKRAAANERKRLRRQARMADPAYRAAHKERERERARERYQTDPAYRESEKERSRMSYQARKAANG